MRTSLFLLAVLAAAPAIAQQKPTTPNDQNKVICRRTPVIGSMIPTKRECHTRAEWIGMGRAGNDAARDMMDRDRGSGSTTPS